MIYRNGLKNREFDKKALLNSLCASFDVQSILCFGSYALGTYDEKSDIDLLVLGKNSIPATHARKTAYNKVPGLTVVSMDNAGFSKEWDNSWSPVNDRVIINKQLIEIGYNKVQFVKSILSNVISKNKLTCKEFPFRPYTFLGLLESSIVLYDTHGFIKKCRKQIRPMPKGLKKAIFNAFMPILKESHEELVTFCERNTDIIAFQFILGRAIDAAIQLLFITNDVYDPASKHTEHHLFKLKNTPHGLKAFLRQILPRFYEKKNEVCRFLEKLIKYLHQKSAELGIPKWSEESGI